MSHIRSFPAPAPRLLSLDLFRGWTILGMILVNNPGTWSHVYAPLRHAHWNGWTPTDLIFPFFLWISGFSLVYSLESRRAKGESEASLLAKIVRRSLTLTALGLFLSGFPFGLLPLHHFSPETWRFPGVLQRIGLAYLFCALLFLRFRTGSLWLWNAGILLVYYGIMRYVPVPGYGAGVWSPEGNLARWIDSYLFGPHTWSGSPAPGFDPEGIVTTAGAVSSMLWGVLSGIWFRGRREGEMGRILTGLLAGVTLFFLGSLWNLWWPINKNLWSGSFALLSAGLALILFSLLYWMEERLHLLHKFRLPVLYGRNAIFSYLLAGLAARLLLYTPWPAAQEGRAINLKAGLYTSFFAPFAPPEAASLAFALLFTLLFSPLLYLLDRRRWYFKV